MAQLPDAARAPLRRRLRIELGELSAIYQITTKIVVMLVPLWSSIITTQMWTFWRYALCYTSTLPFLKMKVHTLCTTSCSTMSTIPCWWAERISEGSTSCTSTHSVYISSSSTFLNRSNGDVACCETSTSFMRPLLTLIAVGGYLTTLPFMMAT